MDAEQEKRGVKMDLRELLAGGGSFTEIRASEILIIKPLAGTEDCRSGCLKGTDRKGDGKREREGKCNKDGRKACERELEKEVKWTKKKKDKEREKYQPWTQASSEKMERKFDMDDVLHSERGVRVSELLSKFGEHTKKHPKLPSRSKSSECFIRTGRFRGTSGLGEEDFTGEENNLGIRGVPKRSFSFSDREKCAIENGIKDEKNHEKVVERTYSDRRVAPWRKVMERRCSERGEVPGGCPSDKAQARKLRGGCIKVDREVKNKEASFARRVSIKHDGREKPVEMDVMRVKEESVSWMERPKSTEREVVIARQTESQMCEGTTSVFRRGSDGRDSITSVGIPPTLLDIHIPTTVFYGVGETPEKKKPSLLSEDEDQSCKGGKDVERRDSWRIGKPLSRIESLREKIRQEEDKLRNMDDVATSGDEEDVPEGMEKAVTRWARRALSSDRCEEGERGSQIERERQRQESSAPQTIQTQEVSVLKAGPQLPVPLLFSQAVKEEEETIAVSNVNWFSSHTIEGEDPTKHVVEDLRCENSLTRKQDTRSRGGGGDQGEEKTSEEEHRQHYFPRSRSTSPLNSISPSPPHLHSLTEMSRIYNLKPVGSRTAVCLTEKTTDRPIPLPTTKVQSQTCAAHKEPCSPERTVGRLKQKQMWVGGVALGSKTLTSEENAGLKTVQRQFTIRSASGNKQVKRGTTITITPRKPIVVVAMETVAVSSGPPAKTSAQAQLPVLTEVVETGKKRYPTVEEIQVIGGYQNLDKSCLVKSPKGSRKEVKVCFDEAQLEQVCEYPSESSLLSSTPSLPSQEKASEDKVPEDGEEERGAFVSRSRNAGASAGLRVLRVDESCHR
ncbi:hypothetical protein DPEC_G00204360 [Dallia pectoralis]|uniref:Uncharacterized protein n=1 Tax=Dallia pectoralis TaxID=75939 RepID=A0ACC2G9V0_DALPE|nr:hypothetical protein DPEC_G00204360 [Dallia pectoralis]